MTPKYTRAFCERTNNVYINIDPHDAYVCQLQTLDRESMQFASA